jgi:hypothetical protein
MPLHVSALGGGAALSVIRGVSFSFSVIVDSIFSTVAWSCSSWHSISNSISPIFIFTRIGGFASFSVKLFTYCLLNCASCSCTTFKYFFLKQLVIGESW